MNSLSRRKFLKISGATIATAAVVASSAKTVIKGADKINKEAVKGMGFDLLIICGFAFDPHVSEKAKRYGKLNILITRMNPDLAMGDALLKTTGTGNLFMVFGEPTLTTCASKDPIEGLYEFKFNLFTL